MDPAINGGLGPLGEGVATAVAPAVSKLAGALANRGSV
jgi:hypothetical protein